MKIESSAVAMQGASSYSHYQESSVTSISMSLTNWNRLQDMLATEKEETGAELSISEGSRKLFEKNQAEKSESPKQSIQEALEESQEAKGTDLKLDTSSKDEQMLKVLRQILSMLEKLRKGKRVGSVNMVKEFNSASLKSIDNNFQTTMEKFRKEMTTVTNMSASSKLTVVDLRGAYNENATIIRDGNSGVGTTWVRHTEVSSYVMEQESTSFSATGIAKTADGREISFGIELGMSRAFAGNMLSSRDDKYILTDPLVINLEGNSAEVTNQKFFFDLDEDGRQEEISSLGKGSGFLAYDKNGDGVINDGSELFGTKSGDGFADLAAYDEDGNGWIDENDSIFNSLKVWTKDEDGTDKLLDLKEANVGAIYLGSANTQYHLNDAISNITNAVIQKTGVFLRETGEVGTIQHVDLAV